MAETEHTADYYRGVADAMDIVREWEFPFTNLVDVIADRLAPEPSASEGGGRQVITKDDLDDAIGTPRETSVKLDWTLQCYGNLEMRNAEIRRENVRLRELLRRVSDHFADEGGPLALTADIHAALPRDLAKENPDG